MQQRLLALNGYVSSRISNAGGNGMKGVDNAAEGGHSNHQKKSQKTKL